MLTPISNAYLPFFRHQCSVCARWTDSPRLMADEQPGRFVCIVHWAADDHARAERAYNEQFRAMTPEQKHAVRVTLFGEFQAGQIEKAAR